MCAGVCGCGEGMVWKGGGVGWSGVEGWRGRGGGKGKRSEAATTELVDAGTVAAIRERHDHAAPRMPEHFCTRPRGHFF